MFRAMMSSVTCPNCGAALVAGAKFCRQCGRLVVDPHAPSVTEATTRTLRTPAEFSAPPTDFFSAQPTTPAYMSPAQMPPPAYANFNSEQQVQKRNVWLISLLATLCVLSLIALAIVAFTKNSATVSQPPPLPPPPSVEAPEIPQPPPPPVAPSNNKTGANPISRAFIYPGAETVMDMTRFGKGSMLQLRTKDSYEEVLDWYVAKLKPDNIIKSPGSNAVLRSEKLMAIINSSGEGTNIVLKEVDEDDLDFDR